LEKLFKILNCTEDSSIDEINRNYLKLKNIYLEERFKEGEEGNNAAKKLTELENAYSEILSYKKSQEENSENNYDEVKDYISKGNLSQAQNVLDSFNERNAKWHYYQSVIFYKKSWYNESKKQLEIAKNMDPNEKKYQEEYDSLVNYLNSANKQNNQSNNNSTTYQSNQEYNNQPQMGGDSCISSCLQCIACNLCFNCFTNVCCGC